MQSVSLLAKRLVPWVVLILGLALSFLLGKQIKDDIEHDAHTRFTIASDQVSIKLSERLQTLGLVLRAGAGVFSASMDVSRDQWHAYVQQLQPQLNLPGVQGIGFAELLLPQQLDQHVAAIRAEGFADYSVQPLGTRELYTPVVFLEPFENRNLRAFGYDMYSDPVRRAAMEQARDSGQPTLSGRVTLMQETDTDVQAGTLLYFPVIRSDMPATTPAERRAALLGWTYSPLRMNDLVNGILGDWRVQWSSEINLYIYDGTEPKHDALLYSSTSADDLNALDNQNPAQQHRILTIGGRSWLLAFDSTPALAHLQYASAWGALLSCITISFLLFGLLQLLASTRTRATRIAEGLTAELRSEHEKLAASEYRWKFALEGAGDGVWDWDIPHNTVFYSHRCKEILGFRADELTNAFSEWETRIHPDDLAPTLAAVQQCLDGRTQQIASEHRLRSKDGSYKWILDRGMVVARDAAGKPLRMLGTVKDITDRKRDEALLQQSRAELLDAQRIARVGSWTMTLATNEVRWSAELFNMFALDPARGAPNFNVHAQLFTADSWQRLNKAVGRAVLDGQPYELELEAVKTDGSHGHMLARGEVERDADGHIVRLRGTAADITARVEARKRVVLLSRLYAALSACNSAIVHCRTQPELLTKICEVVVNHGNMKMAWIGLLDEQSGSIVPSHWAGAGVEYLQGIKVSVSADDPHGKGPSGTATRENRAVWIPEFQTDPSTSPWQARAAGFGWVSSAALPLVRGGKPIGVLTIYSTERGWFTDEIRMLLEEMARDISYALDKFAAEAEMRSYQATLQEAEQRFRSLVEQSFIGAFIVQDHRFVYVNPHMENLLGFPHDGSLLQVMPSSVIPAGEFAEMQLLAEKFSRGELKNLEQMFTARRKDGTSIELGTTISNATYQQKPAIIGLMQDISNRAVAEGQIKRYARNLERVFLQTVSMATNLVEFRDPYTAGHEKHVADIAVAIGTELGLGAQQLEGLRVGGYLHDVGKVTVPAEILAKPGRITPPEYALIKGHPQAGYDILKEVEFPWPVAQIALQHHERIDGSGYPQGLKGDQILFEARIIAVADVVDSMSSHRPYRASLGLDKALAEIELGRGSKYDAAVVDACLLLFRVKAFVLPQ